jgi:predicted 3-demethylubiquinone-9 3-methyltransferase (glyoxalase superfamily)
MQKISPFLWFDKEAEEAAELYTSIFKNSKIVGKTHYPEGAPMPAGSVMTVTFELEGLTFTALNAGPAFKFNESISFQVNVDTQDELDEYWEKLTADGGEESQCGWLKDKFGMSWQITPTNLTRMNSDKDPKKAARTMAAMMKMKKLNIEALNKAYSGE